MNHLESYFQNEYKRDKSEIDEVDNVIKKVIPTFYIAFDYKSCSWPYKIEDNGVPNATNYSVSTNSMIIVMMNLCENNTDREHLFPKMPSENMLNIIKYDNEKWSNVKYEALEKLCEKLKTNSEMFLTDSSTYGANDPLSLLWCAEILEKYNRVCCSYDPEINDKIKRIAKSKYENIATEKILRFCDIEFKNYSVSAAIDDKSIDIPDKYKNNYSIKNPEMNNHSFISLRLLQLVNKLKLDRNLVDETFNFFEQCLHLHLSYSEIPDSRFDPAELVFCLEGAIRTKGIDSVSYETIERAFSVLQKCQDFTPYWRPVNPIYATAQGQILLPLSVEVGNSLLRICSLLDKGSTSNDNPFSKHADMFKRYFRWLKAQMRQITVDRQDCCGWASEHVGGDKEIHLFQTSEILCFLVNYRHMLQDRIARRSLLASGLKVDSPKRKNEHSALGRSDYWQQEIEPNFEPLIEADVPQKFQIYKEIGAKFIKPRDEKTPEGEEEYSMLLYGPPGTGKSTVGENIANTLNWKFITVTPSDFLAGGAGEVEARAKFIFKCLEEQKESVILFDEIDHFLLDRESNSYKTQTGIFQFMTPGMLPKINDLRKRKRSIFIIATNFEERIDPAIKRKGRIDRMLPLMPPAFQQRFNIINREKLQSLKSEDTAGCTFIDLTKGEGKPSLKEELYYVRLGLKFEKNKINAHQKSILGLNFGKYKEKVNDDAFESIDYEKIPIIEYLLLCLIKMQKKGQPLSFNGRVENAEIIKVLDKFNDELTRTEPELKNMFNR